MTKKVTKKKCNPNKANQYRTDPRQSLFLSYYLDPKSETFSNALQSALRAGYEQQTAESLTAKMPKWLQESVGDDYLVRKAEGNLKEFLEMETMNTGITKKGDEFTFDDPKLKKIKQDTTKFTLERLNKKKYAQKVEAETETKILEIRVNDKQLEQLIRARAKRSNT